MRQLATIQRIDKIEPIENKDKIVLATILGWTVIIQKDQFKVGDLCVYIESDSILPEKPEFEFLRKRCYSPKLGGFIIKSMKMAGVVSQGIVFSIGSILNKDQIKELTKKDPIGQDVTEFLSIRKYDPELTQEDEDNKRKTNPVIAWLAKFPIFKKLLFPIRTKSKWPSFISKTDETRFQVLGNSILEYINEPYSVTEKLDGQSASYALYKNKFYVCSRNMLYFKKCNNNYWQVAEKFDIKNKLKLLQKKFTFEAIIQGEIIGPGIQGNKYNLKGLDFYVYNIVPINIKQYLSNNSVAQICYEIGLKSVPLVDNYMNMNDYVLEGFDESIKQYYLKVDNIKLREYARGKSVLNPSMDREGVVIRSFKSHPPARGMSNMFSFKVINPDFEVK